MQGGMTRENKVSKDDQVKDDMEWRDWVTLEQEKKKKKKKIKKEKKKKKKK